MAVTLGEFFDNLDIEYIREKLVTIPRVRTRTSHVAKNCGDTLRTREYIEYISIIIILKKKHKKQKNYADLYI